MAGTLVVDLIGIPKAFYFQSADPSVANPTHMRTGIHWIDTTSSPYIWKRRNAANDGWDSIAKISVDFTVGPASATDNTLVRFDGTTGKLIQNSTVSIDDTGAITVPEMSAPSTPASGKVAIYAKTDGKLYIKDDAGTETDLAATGSLGGSTGATDNRALRADGTGGTTAQSSNLSIPDDALTTEVGYMNIPQNSQSADYTAVLADRGAHLFHPSSDNNPRTFTIPANSSVAYPIGTAITFVNKINVLTIAITSDTLTWADDGSTGSRTLAANGIATALKITSTEWLISGVGLSWWE